MQKTLLCDYYDIPSPNGVYPRQETIDELIRAYMDGNIVICDKEPRCSHTEVKSLAEEPSAYVVEKRYTLGATSRFPVVYGVETTLMAR